MRWLVAPGFVAAAEAGFLAAADRDWRTGSDRAGRRRRWHRLAASPSGEVFLKYYLPRSRLERIKYMLRPSRASAEWRNASRLADAGVGVPALLAIGESRGAGGWCRSILVTESLAGAPTLLEWSRAACASNEARRLGRRLARSIAAMHDHGLFHRDLHGDNVLVTLRGGEPEPYLVDFHEMLRLPWSSRRLCIDDLARLNGFVEAGARQRMRFLRDYLAARGIDRGELRRWLAAIDRRTRRIWDYYDGKGRDYRRYA